MKTNNKWVILILLTMTGVNYAMAQMDNLANLSSEWIRTSARNAATDATDAVVYNPAGITKMSNGFHINFSNQSLFRKPSHTYDLGIGQGVKSYSQDGADAFIPNLYAAYKKDKWALFTGVFISGGGATMNYPEGSITTDLIGLQALMGTGGAYAETKDAYLKASSYYLTTTLGGTYQAGKNISFATAIRYISAKNTAEAGMTLTTSPVDMDDMPLALETEESASGMGFVFGMNVNATEKLNFSTRYESQVNLDFETKQIKDDFGATVNGQMNRRDLPAVLAFGTSYAFSENFRAYADYNYYFQKNADWGKSGAITNDKPWSELAGDASTVAAGFQYKISPAFTASLGGGYTNYAWSETDREANYTRMGTYEVMQDDNYNINTGFSVKASNTIRFNVGYMHTFWAKDQNIKALNADPLDVDVKVNNSMDAIAFGIDISF